MQADNTRLIVDIPSVTLTALTDLETLMSRSAETWRCQPGAIVYPATWAGGLTTATDTLFGELSNRPGESLDAVVKFCGAKGLDLWLDVNLDLAPVRSDLIHVKDFYGGSAAHACINSPASHSALSLILSEIAPVVGRVNEGPLRGVVFSLQDLWPLAGQEVIELHCFCEHCRAFFDGADPQLLSRFQGTPNPWDLGLMDTGTGIDHINNIPSTVSPQEILQLSLAKGFYASKVRRDTEMDITGDPRLLDWASYLITYINVKHDLTVNALQKICKISRTVLGDDLIIAGVVSESLYDWLSGLFFDRVDHHPPVDEFWINPSNSGVTFQSAPFRYYLWERSRYYVMEFLTLLETVIAGSYVNEQFSASRARRLALNRAGIARGKMMAPITMRLLNPLPNAKPESVVVPMFRDSMEELVDAIVPPTDDEDEALGLLARLRAKVTGEEG